MSMTEPLGSALEKRNYRKGERRRHPLMTNNAPSGAFFVILFIMHFISAKNFATTRLLASILLFAILASCSNSHSDHGNPMNGDEPSAADSVPEIKQDSLRAGMMRINPNGKSVLLGVDGMRVKLGYDYSLGIHEVTCGEFNEMGRTEGWNLTLECAQDDLPATQLTYYDVVLFANAYSRLHGYDTVYAYHNRLFNFTDHCVNLEGLEFRTDVDGFRLPTEAEWELAALQSWNPERYSWNAMNSNYELHVPCAFPDSLGFCDLAGNALELTNDWLGSLKDSIVENFVGAPAGNSLLEKVVKGGSMAQWPNEMNLVSRSDVYPVTSSTVSSYIGFRLAFGKIPNAVWMNGFGDVATSLVKMKTFSSDIREKMGTVHAKLAFRNDKTGNLAYVDFSGGMPGVIEILDTLPVFHPEISPDGNKVAFCTGTEGVNGSSAVYVRNLDATGSGLVKLDVENAAIPRWFVDADGDTSIVYVDNAGDNSVDAEFFARGTWMVPFANGSFGTPKKLMDGAYHSGVSRDAKWAVSGARHLRVHKDGNDEIWYDGEQACNASLSKGGLNRILFLDFGGTPGRAFAKEKYGVHERLLVADSSGKLMHAIPAPKGFSFDHSEWVSRDNWAVVSLVNAQGNHSTLALVNVLDSSVVELAEGDDLWHPNLWVMSRALSENSELDLDSAGLYWDPIYQSGSKPACLKMRMFWDMRDSLDVIAVGTSRTERGFDPSQISGSALNFGFVGADLYAQLYLMDNYIVPHATKLKYLIVEISYDHMYNSTITRMNRVFGQAPGYYYDRNHHFWKDGVPKDFERVVDANVRYSSVDSLEYVNTKGLLKLESHGWGDEPEINGDSVLPKIWKQNFEKNIDSLTAFIDSTQNKGFKIIGLVYPQSPQYANTGSFGRSGVRRSTAMVVTAYFDSLAKVYPHFILMDENKFGAHDYTDEKAYDYDHLSALGARYLSGRLDSLLKTLR